MSCFLTKRSSVTSGSYPSGFIQRSVLSVMPIQLCLENFPLKDPTLMLAASNKTTEGVSCF